MCSAALSAAGLHTGKPTSGLGGGPAVAAPQPQPCAGLVPGPNGGLYAGGPACAGGAGFTGGSPFMMAPPAGSPYVTPLAGGPSGLVPSPCHQPPSGLWDAQQQLWLQMHVPGQGQFQPSLQPVAQNFAPRAVDYAFNLMGGHSQTHGLATAPGGLPPPNAAVGTGLFAASPFAQAGAAATGGVAPDLLDKKNVELEKLKERLQELEAREKRRVNVEVRRPASHSPTRGRAAPSFGRRDSSSSLDRRGRRGSHQGSRTGGSRTGRSNTPRSSRRGGSRRGRSQSPPMPHCGGSRPAAGDDTRDRSEGSGHGDAPGRGGGSSSAGILPLVLVA